MLIEITRDLKGWRAVFYGGDMPQRIALPLPFTYSAKESDVRADLEKRFPGAMIEAPHSHRGPGR